MSKLLRGGSWVAGSIGIISGIFNLVDRYMTLEYQDRQSRMMHDEAVLEISERASIIRAKIESDARNFEKCIGCLELQLESENDSFKQVQALLIDTIREISDAENKLQLIDRLAIMQKSFYEHKTNLLSASFATLPNWQLPGNPERKQVTSND